MAIVKEPKEPWEFLEIKGAELLIDISQVDKSGDVEVQVLEENNWVSLILTQENLKVLINFLQKQLRDEKKETPKD